MMAAAWLELVYLAVLGISLLFGGVFSVDRNNHYMRGDAFWIYLSAYFMSIVYLLLITARTIRKYQNKSKSCIYLIAIFSDHRLNDTGDLPSDTRDMALCHASVHPLLRIL